MELGMGLQTGESFLVFFPLFLPRFYDGAVRIGPAVIHDVTLSGSSQLRQSSQLNIAKKKCQKNGLTWSIIFLRLNYYFCFIYFNFHVVNYVTYFHIKMICILCKYFF
jgi:hypothetical protein